MNRRQFTKLLAGAGLLLAGCRAGAAPSSSTPERKDSMQTTTQTYTRTTPIETVRNDPVFGDYGRLIFPVERSYYSGDTLEQLHLTYYNNIDPDETVDICNSLRQRAADGQTIFYDIYTEDERVMHWRIETIRSQGTPAEIEVFPGLAHGFGLGTGTSAEGWLDHAVAFWEENT